MTNFITTPSRALQIVASNNCDIPTPNLLTSGTNTTDVLDELIDTSANFIINGINVVNVGDVVYNYADSRAATIIDVVDEHTLLLNADIFAGATGIEYFIYQQSPLTGSQNEGCLLYVKSLSSNEGTADITTAGNDRVSLLGISTGVLPVKIKKLWKDNTDGLDTLSFIALW
jgi:hypothetical protein